MNMNNLKYLFLLLLVSAMSCTQPPDYPDEPVITFKSMSKNTMRQGSLIGVGADSLLMTISFTDGDGDLGEEGVLSPLSNVYLIDQRINDTLLPQTIPFIPVQGAGNGISGDISFVLFPSCCIYLGQACEVFEEHPVDTVQYSIFIRDRAGNFSNQIESNPVFLLCQ